MNTRTTPSRPEKPAQLNFRLSNDEYLLFSALAEHHEMTKHGLFLAWLERELYAANLSPSAVPGGLSEEAQNRLYAIKTKVAGQQSYQNLGIEKATERMKEQALETLEGVMKFREEVIDGIQQLMELLFELGQHEVMKLEQLRKIDIPYVATLPSEYKPVREIAKYFEDKRGVGRLEEFRIETLKCERLAYKLVDALNNDQSLKLRQAIQNLRIKNDDLAGKSKD